MPRSPAAPLVGRRRGVLRPLCALRSLTAADSAVDSRHDQSFTHGRRSVQADRPGLMSLFADNYRPAHP